MDDAVGNADAGGSPMPVQLLTDLREGVALRMRSTLSIWLRYCLNHGGVERASTSTCDIRHPKRESRTNEDCMVSVRPD